ncbi:MAG TPA: gamma-glutamylcyclotransferase family protein [Candidatus Dormibacteraeota bacterium]|nr:gamma-glutamylcyclotransferase family protein [Candidatus Dormibacteraeota bacterium]
MPNFVWYFAFASNMNRAQMSSRIGEIAEEKSGKLENYEIVFNKKARGGAAMANIRPASGKCVYGVLYQITEAALKTLDRFEGAPEHYRRIEVTVTDTHGGPVRAQAYIATKVEKGLHPAPHYLQAMLQAAAEYQFPAEYIEELKRVASAG